ncbi:hypothetical protein BpHYR1_005838, partial [Brachionus plicatilis]
IRILGQTGFSISNLGINPIHHSNFYTRTRKKFILKETCLEVDDKFKISFQFKDSSSFDCSWLASLSLNLTCWQLIDQTMSKELYGPN